jgi:hypothetical protein
MLESHIDHPQILIADFGLSKFSNPKEKLKLACGTLGMCV